MPRRQRRESMMDQAASTTASTAVNTEASAASNGASPVSPTASSTASSSEIAAGSGITVGITPGANGRTRPPTIRDVAGEAGVSKSLVSLVFNGGENVSEERRQRVLQAAERLGYRPNLVAQSLSAGHPHHIAILA